MASIPESQRPWARTRGCPAKRYLSFDLRPVQQVRGAHEHDVLLAAEPFRIFHDPAVSLVKVRRLPDMAVPSRCSRLPVGLDHYAIFLPVDAVVGGGQLLPVPVSRRAGQVVHVVLAVMEIQPRIHIRPRGPGRKETGLTVPGGIRTGGLPASAASDLAVPPATSSESIAERKATVGDVRFLAVMDILLGDNRGSSGSPKHAINDSIGERKKCE